MKKVEETNRTQFRMYYIELQASITLEQALFIAKKIVDFWNAKIEYEDMKTNGKARVFKDPEYGEVFVTIDCKEE